MSLRPIIIATLTTSLFLFGCDGTQVEEDEEPVQQPAPDDEEDEPAMQQDEEPDDEEMTLLEPSEDSAELMEMIEDYEEWDHHAGLDTHFESGHPGAWVIAYANDEGVETVEQYEIPVPEGAIFVKEEYDEDGAEDPSAVTVMEKQSDEMHDWYWLKTDPELEGVLENPEGMALEGPDVAGCVDCHSEQADQDYLMAPGVGDQQ